ncbi:MAG: Hsp33 family molecular chaperone HslO [Oceanospirillaceae bacterium]|nr:Hsp33 family molecular chaperone HslO [Oceanospirillaceae bacterium]|tara:strand:- start:1289 stop:2152 length:864 start_codon:yes stop_codon:yes gene_type:complete
MTGHSQDQLQRFSFDHTSIRGELAHLNSTFQDVIRRHAYPRTIAIALGELMAATALLSASLKFPGRLTLQLRLTGNVTLLQAETDEKGRMRAIARYEEGADTDTLSLDDGQMVLTMEPENGQRYQGITAIEQGNVAKALEDYFEQSEQLASRFWLHCDGRVAAGLMLQKMPASQGVDPDADPDAWDRLGHLASTVKEDELLHLDNEDLLHRLYHEEAVRVYPSSALQFWCSCSKDRIGNALHQLGYDELQDILREQGSIAINCEFCQQAYSFDAAQIDELFPERTLQ